MSIDVLVVDDDSVQREMVGIMLTKSGYGMIAAESAQEAISALEARGGAALAILDISLPGGVDGMELLELLRGRYPSMPVVMLTGNKNLDVAVKSMRMGAYDFMTKPVERERLRSVVGHALKTNMLEKEVRRLKAREDGAGSFEDLIGYDGGLAGIMRAGLKAAGTDLPALLTGETGTGKEVFARAIHGQSVRSGAPFVAVNCGAIPAQLVESTLFGHEKGAFTGAVARAIGKFREAEGGTIFLDEIGDLPLDAQVKLLRVLQQKEITPVGADKSTRVNVRVLSATHHDLAGAVAEGRFREDLYFRLNVLHIHMPPLRERTEDIPALARHFIERFAASEGRILCDLSAAALNYLMSHKWAGNVRALENAVHRAMVMSDAGVLDVHDFADVEQLQPHSVQGRRVVPALRYADGVPRPLADIEAEALQGALSYFAGNVTKAAEALGLAKSTFYRRIKEQEIS